MDIPKPLCRNLLRKLYPRNVYNIFVPELPFSIQPEDVRDFYRQRGYDVLYPDELAACSDAELRSLAAGITGVADVVFSRDRELSESRTEELSVSVRNGNAYPFVLLAKGRVVGSSALTRVASPFPDSPVQAFAIGAATKIHTPRAPMLRLFAAQVGWAQQHLSSQSYIVAHTRVAARAPGRPYNGNVFGQALRFAIPAHGNYAHHVGPTTAEPFMFSVAPLDLARGWERFSETVYVPSEAARVAIANVFLESEHTDNSPNLKVCTAESTTNSTPVDPPNIYRLGGPNALHESVYMMTDNSGSSATIVPNIPSAGSGKKFSPTLSDRVIVESDITSNPQQAGSVYPLLAGEGFTFLGITFSALAIGRLALVFGRPGFVGSAHTIARPDLSALQTMPATQRFFAEVLQSQRPIPQETLVI